MFDDVFFAAERKMIASLNEARARFSHPGCKGGCVETAVREFLRGYLPRRLAVGTGEVVDTLGRRSAQTDIVIATEDHPFTFTGDEAGLFFIEGGVRR